MSRLLCRLVLVLAALACVERAQGAGRAHSDAEVVLQITSITPGSTLNLIGSGVKQVGTTSTAVYDSLNRLRIGGTFPASGVNVPMTVGGRFELDIQAGVRTDFLSLGESAELQIDISSNLAIQNTGITDATLSFAFEREYFLNTFLNDHTEFGRARGEFEMLATSFDSAGIESDRFPFSYEGQVLLGAGSAGPQDHFNFDLLIPAGGSGSVAMHAMAYSQVALVPEPGSAVLLIVGAAALVFTRRRISCWHPVANL